MTNSYQRLVASVAHCFKVLGLVRSISMSSSRPARDRLILFYRSKGHSLSALAKQFDLSKSRISQIVNKKKTNYG